VLKYLTKRFKVCKYDGVKIMSGVVMVELGAARKRKPQGAFVCSTRAPLRSMLLPLLLRAILCSSL
jgi:hypothetical protein